MISQDLLVVDASIAVKWYIAEPDSAKALTLITGRRILTAPNFLPVEIGNVVWKRTRRGDMTLDDARSIALKLAAGMPVELHTSDSLVPAAMEIGLKFDRTVYDSLYLALAMREHCQMITADERLFNRLRGTEIEPYIMALGQY